MGDVYWGVHTPLAVLAAKSGLKNALETGTYYGTGALQLSALFENVWSVDSNEVFSSFCRSTYSSIDNVAFKHDSASNAINSILKERSDPFFFFLDAHWFPNDQLNLQPEGTVQCEILDEIKIISQYRTAKDGSFIVIDDADMFLGSLPPPFRNDDFPSIVSLTNALKKCFKATYVDVFDDVIVACSNQYEPAISDYKNNRAKYGVPGTKKISI